MSKTTDRKLLEDAMTLVAKYHARQTILVDWEKSVIEAINTRLAEPEDRPERLDDNELYELWRGDSIHFVSLRDYKIIAKDVMDAFIKKNQ